MDTLIAFAFGSLKVLVLLVAAAFLTTALRKRPARLRVVVWSTALTGSLLIPLVAPFLPPLQLPLPVNFGLADRVAAADPFPPHAPSPFFATVRSTGAAPSPFSSPVTETALHTVIHPSWLAVGWALGALAVLSHLAIGLWRMERTVRRAPTVGNTDWQIDLAWACERVGCWRPVRLALSPELDIPATVGVLRPTILLPSIAMRWDRDRREAVLLHELIHVSRLDWPLRIVARLARAAYWFNPLAWWAANRLDLEQELACDEEVVALGTRPSSYACHLLGIARALGGNPIPAAHGLHIIRRSHLEERIMTILDNKHHRRAGLVVLAPAAILIAALVPALAAVAPTDPVPASPEIKQILAEMKEAEARFEPNLERIKELEIEMTPEIEALENIEVTIDVEAIAAIEERMKPYLERIAEIEIDMESFHEQMEALHRELEPLNREIAEMHVNMEPFHEQMEAIHRELEPLHERMDELHLEMEPFHEEMEELGRRLEDAIRTEVSTNLRRHLGAVTGPNSPFTEAAARIVEAATIHGDEDDLRINAPQDETRQILTDLFAANRIGTQQSFDDAIDAAVASMSPMVISVE